MPKIKTRSRGDVILAHTLQFDEWISLLGTDRWPDVHPANCFPSNEHKEAYLSRINEPDDCQFRLLARCFLNKSGNYGCDRDRLLQVITKYGPNFHEDKLHKEFDRRSLPRYEPQWEGVTWALDLLPDKPHEAISVISSYIHAHFLHLTDQMVFGHNDVIHMIRARYKMLAKYTCFISYGGPDQKFAEKLYKSLVKIGVEAFFFPSHAIAGEKLHKLMRKGVNEYDKIILICTKASLDRPGVLNELTETLQREARNGGKEYLIPIRLDDYVFTGWSPDDPGIAQAVRDRVVADFTGTGRSSAKYKRSLDQLVRALQRPHTPK